MKIQYRKPDGSKVPQEDIDMIEYNATVAEAPYVSSMPYYISKEDTVLSSEYLEKKKEVNYFPPIIYNTRFFLLSLYKMIKQGLNKFNKTK